LPINRTSSWRRRRGPALAILLLLAGLLPARTARAAELAAAAVDFAFGVLAYDQGDVAEAARLFEQAAHENDRDGTTLHWLGLTYLRLGRTREAVRKLEESLKAPERPEAGREQVRADLEKARALLQGKEDPSLALKPPQPPQFALPFRAPGEAPFWELRLSGRASHDSNPSLLAEGLDLATPSGARVQGGTADGFADLGLRAEVHPFYGRRGWSLGLAASADRSVYRDLKEFDLGLASGLVQLAWGRDPLGLLTGPLGYARVPYGNGRFALLLQAGGTDARLGGDPYLRSAEGALAVLVRESPQTVTRLDLDAVDRTYSHDAADATRQSGRETSIGVSQLLFFGRRDFALRLGLAAGNRTAGRALAATSRTALAQASIPLSNRLSLFAAGERREDRFAHPDSNLFRPGGPARNDVTWRFTAALSLRLLDRLYWTVRGSYARRSSNADVTPGVPLFDYRRTVLSTGFDWFL